MYLTWMNPMKRVMGTPFISFHPEMALFRNLCVNLRNYLTLRKIANFSSGNLICGQFRFMNGHQLVSSREK